MRVRLTGEEDLEGDGEGDGIGRIQGIREELVTKVSIFALSTCIKQDHVHHRLTGELA
jgi:hypothetical protein